jgi:hypothetical protein
VRFSASPAGTHRRRRGTSVVSGLDDPCDCGRQRVAVAGRDARAAVQVPVFANLQARLIDVARGEIVQRRLSRERRVGDREMRIDAPPQIRGFDLAEVRSQVRNAGEVARLARIGATDAKTAASRAWVYGIAFPRRRPRRGSGRRARRDPPRRGSAETRCHSGIPSHNPMRGRRRSRTSVRTSAGARASNLTRRASQSRFFT